jgi:hypothetical protein
MARRRSGGGARWWWLAPPLIGVAAYLAFDATLGVLAPDDAPSAGAGRGAPPVASVERPPAALPPAELAPAADVPPEPTPTAAQQRAAAPAGAAPGKPGKKSLPRESLTEADRRALEKVLERATQGANAR